MNWLSQQCFPQSGPVDIPYFLDPQSTTDRALTIDPKGFEIYLMNNGFAKAMPEEYQCLGIDLQDIVWVREVELRLLARPVMLARAVISCAALEHSFNQIKYLGTQSLGYYLFRLPDIRRSPFEFKQLKQGNELYQRALPYQGQNPSDLWARRSVFSYQEEHLLLTEVFLPQYSQVFGAH